MRKSTWRFLLAAGFAALARVAHSADFPPCPSVNPDQVRAFYSDLTPGISWAAWSELLGQRWTRTAIVEGSRFDEARVARAIASIGPQDVGGLHLDDYEDYKPPSGAGTPQQDAAYHNAASLYRGSDWSESIPEFDAIVADKDSPYRAAAAYSAARAAFRSGDIRGGIGRIARVVSDPSLQEYRLAAHHLLGTMSYLTGNPQIVAARYAEIENLLIAPPEIVCHDAELHRLVGEANQGLHWYLDLAFPRDAFHFGRSGSVTTREVLDRLAADDPLLDLVRVLAAPTPYTLAWDWAGGQRRLEAATQRRDWRKDDAFAFDAFAASDAPALTAHARERWLATGQVLWGYALAQRTSELEDAELIRRMREGLGSLPASPAVRAAVPVFQWHLLRHEIRILLMHNRVEQAIALLRDLPKSGRAPNVPYVYHYFSASDEQAIVNGGVRALLERFDLDGARRWAAESAKALPYQLSEELRVLLATGFDDPALREGENRGTNSLRAVVDLLPARRMTTLATSAANLKSDQRRAFLAAGWLRIYLLGDWERSKALLPKLREAFPELATDIDNIEGSWFDATRKRLVVRMLLRTPGLTHSSMWIRTQTGYLARDMFSIDSHNPNDGNWWCPLDVDQVKRTLATVFFAEPLHLQDYLRFGYWRADGVGADYLTAETERRKSLTELADKLIAWHPLLKEVDPDELVKLSKVESGPKLLSDAALQWAGSSGFISRWLGRDRLLPETLHLAVRSTRYGCRRAGGHAEYSRAAFVQLHRLFPNSEWAEKTPYWFDKP